MLNDLYFKTTCNIRPYLLDPMGGLKIEGPLYQYLHFVSDCRSRHCVSLCYSVTACRPPPCSTKATCVSISSTTCGGRGWAGWKSGHSGVRRQSGLDLVTRVTTGTLPGWTSLSGEGTRYRVIQPFCTTYISLFYYSTPFCNPLF